MNCALSDFKRLAGEVSWPSHFWTRLDIIPFFPANSSFPLHQLNLRFLHAPVQEPTVPFTTTITHVLEVRDTVHRNLARQAHGPRQLRDPPAVACVLSIVLYKIGQLGWSYWEYDEEGVKLEIIELGPQASCTTWKTDERKRFDKRFMRFVSVSRWRIEATAPQMNSDSETTKGKPRREMSTGSKKMNEKGKETSD